MTFLKELVSKFKLLVECYWNNLSKISELESSGALKQDWLQVNWELLVEGLLRKEDEIVLEPYGDGAECNGASSRVLYPEKKPTHCIICESTNDDNVYDFLNKKLLMIPEGGVIFDRLVSIREDGWYYEEPPFDKVLCDYQGKPVVLDFDDVELSVKKT
ncbi:MAG: hypothetical protein ACR2PX_23760 [Endozoicomonas sp.]|uniref:hypothetical protein n=1 Tax=Endozoicomonas sp. TaxID=1892382 RepID=UPI003D9B7C62